jgi:alpha-L-fucosidase 2
MKIQNSKLKQVQFIFAVLLLVCNSCTNKKEEPQLSELKLWYKQPANASVKDSPNGWKDDAAWLNALPLGNGSLGLMVFGDVNKERIQFNEESMWSGSYSDNDNPDAFAEQDKIRKLLFDGKYKEATKLTNETQIAKGKGSGHGNGANVPFGCFQTLGDLWIDNGKNTNYENYYRELDLEDAIIRVNYSQEGVNFEREIFTSQPDQVMVAKFTADKPGQISFTCSMNRPEAYKSFSENNQLIMSGALSDGKGGEGLQYMTRLKAVNKNGKVIYGDSILTVENADEVILYLSASTDYVLDYPDFKGREYEKITNKNITKAVSKPYSELLDTHKNEYQKYFKRVSFDITPDPIVEIPTDERLKSFKQTSIDPHLSELIFQYGRYLLISSSRPGTLPANLQGIWANKIQTPWNGDYHTDVNIEMNYWLAEVTNLSEMHMPMFDLIESLVAPGKQTATIQYHKKGWVVHPITNVWGYTSPGESATWGMHTGAGAWLCSHIWEHFSFTNDKDFLNRMYPVLRGSVAFYMDWLVENPITKELVSGPAVSPENTFLAPDGSKSQISMGPAHDQQVIWQLFTDFILASDELEIKDEFIVEVENAKKRLAGPKIGSDGRLMEWAEEFPEVEPGHRHISHLFALHPGAQINMERTPKLAKAAKKSLDHRIKNGGGHTGWSAAWLISQYARLQESEKAKESLNTVLSKSTSPNLFGQHPPFQMDANFGATAGIAEMLIQSHTGTIHLLPAIPIKWRSGEVKGLKARGDFEVDIKWENGQLVNLKVKSEHDGICKLRYGNNVIEIRMKSGDSKLFDYSLKEIK